jgi:hypothetical protein
LKHSVKKQLLVPFEKPTLKLAQSSENTFIITREAAKIDGLGVPVAGGQESVLAQS